MGRHEIQGEPEIILTEIVQQAQPGDIPSLLTDAGSIETSPAKNVRVLPDQLHARLTREDTLRGQPDQGTARLAVLVLGAPGVNED